MKKPEMELFQKQLLLEKLSAYIMPERYSRMNKILEYRTRHLCVVMEDIYQAQNASAVLRTCDCLGVQDVHIIENRNPYEINPEVALGASKWLSLYKYNQLEHNTELCLSQLKEKGYRLIATSPHKDDLLIDELKTADKTALLFGTELIGLSEEAQNMADAFLKIPMYGFTESFNISVSAAICLYNLTLKIRGSNAPWQLSEEERTDIFTSWILESVKRPDALMEHIKKEMGLSL